MITYTFLAIITIFSVYCFMNPAATQKYLFYPYAIKRENEHYRFLTHAFIHGDYLHLGFNCIALYSFGLSLEEYLLPRALAGPDGVITIENIRTAKIYYLILFTGGIYAASFTEYLRNKNNPTYSSLGASGAISSIMFAWILLEPGGTIGMFVVKLPGWVWGILLLALSFYLIQRKRKGTYSDGISHEAHFWGAIFGILFVGIAKPDVLVKFVKYIFSAFQ